MVLTQILPSPVADSSSAYLFLTSTSGFPSRTGTVYFFASSMGSSFVGEGGVSMTETFCSPGLGISNGLEQAGQSICSPDRVSSVVRFWPQCGQSKLRSAMLLERLRERTNPLLASEERQPNYAGFLHCTIMRRSAVCLQPGVIEKISQIAPP